MATTQKQSSWSKRFIVILNTIPGMIAAANQKVEEANQYRI